jgi:DNA invertase Pin-like site-specific DNA recombinase
MKYGYARVSNQDQNLALQLDALKACDRVFEEKISGTTKSRPQLDALLDTLRAGDVLVVYKLDRLGRSLSHLIDVVEMLRERDVGFASVSESVDTTTPGGRLFFHLLGAVAEFERDLIVERTNAGIKAAKASGTHCGRPRALGWEQLAAARKLLEEGRSQRQVARLFKVSDATLSRRLREAA